MTSLNNNTVVSPVVAQKVVALPKKATVQIVESAFDIKQKKSEYDVLLGMDVLVEKSIEELVRTGLVFDRGNILVCIDRDNSVHQLNATTIRFALSKLVNFVKTTYNKGTSVTEPVNCPSYIGETISSMTKWRGMPIIDAVTDHPVLTSDNKLIGSGYNKSTKTFGRFDDANFNIPVNPSFEDAIKSLEEVQKLLQTFEFEGAGDESATLSAMLTAVSRPVLSTALLTLIDAPMSGSGKGYLGGLLAKLACNAVHPAKQLPDNHDEIRKVITSSLLSAKPVLFFDELAMSEIDCPSIRTLATAEIFSDRMLGSNRDIDVSTKTFVVCTGNNISPTADTARRMLHIRLNPMCENPSSRQFSYDAEAEMTAKRDEFVSHLLTIQRAFLLANTRGETTKPAQAIGGFKDWDLMCRQPILWLTGVDSCTRMLETMKSNPAKNDLLAMINAWTEAFGDVATKASDAIRNEAFKALCEDYIKRKPGSQITSIGVGMWIKKHKGQVVDKKYFDEDVSVNGVQYWVVRSI